MTLTDSTVSAFTAPAAPAHPLASLTPEEITAVRAVVAGLDGIDEATRFAYVGLEEAPKGEVLAWERGEAPAPERRARVQLLNLRTAHSLDLVVSLATGAVLRSTELDGSDGQLPILDAEFEEVGVIVPLSAGHYGYENEMGRRVLRTFAFRQDHPADHPWAHPVDGLTAYIDVAARAVIEIVDTPGFTVPETHGNFDDPELQGPPLEGLKPIVITQPEGSSFTVDGEHVTWGEWDLRIGFDCVGDITYVDAVLSDENGMPRTIRNAVCMHEEDFGSLWKHSDIFTGSSEVRRARRLVISFFTTVGNYDYGFYWYLYLDGTIECEAKLTGILFTSAYPGEGYPFASEVAPGLGAPYHQHLFSARLDMTVDGVANVVNEIDAVRVPISATNPAGNAFTKKVTPITSEKVSGRVADGGQATSYVLFPTETPVLLADDDSSIAARAAFATKNLFVTKYDPAERYAAGDFVNQHPGGAGIPDFISGDEPLVGEDLVLWHTFGLTHFPRNEDWPVMPMDYAKFTLKPYNFFERNPVLNVPAPESAHCSPAAHATGHGDEGHAAHGHDGAHHC